jgi:hypothetical protein
MSAPSLITQLLRERFQTGRSTTLEQWTAEAKRGLDAIWPDGANPALLRQKAQVLRAYGVMAELLEELLRQSTPKCTPQPQPVRPGFG